MCKKRNQVSNYVLMFFVFLILTANSALLTASMTVQMGHNFGAAAFYFIATGLFLIAILVNACRIKWSRMTKQQKW